MNTGRSSDDDTPLDLHRRLTDAAAVYDVPTGDAGAAMMRGRRRSARARRSGAVVMAATLVGTAFATRTALQSDGGRPVPVAAGAGMTRGDDGIAWRVASPAVALGFATAPRGEAPAFALSTAASERDPATARRNSTVWQSQDGVEWVPAGRVANDLYLADLAVGGRRLYAVGTTAATAVAGRRAAYDLVAGWSDDEGKTFTKAPLPLDLRAMAAKTLSVGVSGASVATGPKGTLVVVTVGGALDVRALLPAGVDAPNGWVTTKTGVDLLGSESNCPADQTRMTDRFRADRHQLTEMAGFRCNDADGKPVGLTPQQIFGVAGSFTFEQLGVDGDVLKVARRQPVVFHAEAGSTQFERVEIPETDPVLGPPILHAGDGGFEIVVQSGSMDGSAGGVVALHSGDGRTFTPSAIADIVWPTAIGTVRGVATIVGGSPRGAFLAQSTGDGRWSTRPLLSAVDPEQAQGRTLHPSAAGIGDFGIVVAGVLTEGETGDIVSTRVLASRDAETWSDRPIQDLVGKRQVRGVVRAMVSSRRAVLTVSTGEPDAAGRAPSEQIVLVGVAT